MLAGLELAERDINNISAAVSARQKRQSKDKKVVERGGEQLTNVLSRRFKR